MMRVNISELAGEANLAGATFGRTVLGKLIGVTGSEPRDPQPLVLDFEDASIATGSFLRELVLGARDMMRSRRSNWYPVVANANDTVREELADLLELKGDALLICETDNAGAPINCQPLGRLERIQQLTFELVQRHGETGASELRELHPNPPVEITAWNNRLRSLAERGLVIEYSRGRLKRYRPIAAGA